jgi:hypothetical protein
MMRITAIALAFVLAGLTGLESSRLSAQTDGWVTLFDGKTLNGWNVIGTANWQVVDGAMQATSGNGYLVTPMSYRDVQMVVEFWADDDANSGVFFRCSDLKMISANTAYEVQIFDKRPDPTYRTGSLTFLAKPAAIINVGGKWNTYDITVQGSHVMITLNGTRTVDVQDTTHAAPGPIALQRTAGTIKFRSVRIRPL